MRYLVIGLTFFAAACSAGASSNPTAPTSVSNRIGDTIVRAAAGSELPFKGDLQGSELVCGTTTTCERGVPDGVHYLVATGDGTLLGQFTYSAFLRPGIGGTVVWTAANGDTVLANTHPTSSRLNDAHTVVTITEEQTITGGTGRFAGVSGAVHLTRTIVLATHDSAGSYTGTLNLER